MGKLKKSLAIICFKMKLNDYNMYCPICKKDWVKQARFLSARRFNENNRIICPCEIHTAIERQNEWKKNLSGEQLKEFNKLCEMTNK